MVGITKLDSYIWNTVIYVSGYKMHCYKNYKVWSSVHTISRSHQLMLHWSIYYCNRFAVVNINYIAEITTIH